MTSLRAVLRELLTGVDHQASRGAVMKWELYIIAHSTAGFLDDVMSSSCDAAMCVDHANRTAFVSCMWPTSREYDWDISDGVEFLVGRREAAEVQLL